jgi:hypothetical protein
MSDHVSPVSSLFRALGFLLAGRVRLRRDQVGAVFAAEDGASFRVFRCLEVRPLAGQPAAPGAVFVPRFRVKGISLRQNQWFSWLPILFFIGLPGFRSKRWMVDEARGEFAGYYEWDTLADADAYSRSFAARFMTARSVPGSVCFQVYPRGAAPAPPSPP